MLRDPRVGFVILMLVIIACAIACARPRVVLVPRPTPQPSPTPTGRTVESVVEDLGDEVRARWEPFLLAAGLEYPPAELTLLAFKRERRLEVWGRRAAEDAWQRIDVLPILAASGGPGPKLRQGDRQVPEGLYAIPALNPNSHFHLSMRVDYPNAFDLAEAERVERDDLGGDIFIHGGDRSIGCLAIGDAAIEDLFVLVAEVGIEHVRVVIAPRDPRGGMPLAPIAGLPFTRELYTRITAALRSYPVPVPARESERSE